MRPFFGVASLIVLTSCLLAQTSAPFAQGRIIGTVVNDAGEPVPHASISFGSIRTNGSSSSGGLQADDHGQFDLPVALDTNRILAEKLDGGYWSDGDIQKGQVVRLSAEQPVAHVVLKLGAEPAAVTFNVVNRDSGQPVKGFSVRISVIDDRPFFRTTEIRDQNLIPVPADKDVMLIVQAPGYKRWYFKDAANASQPILRLQSGEQRTVDVELEPNSARN